MWVMIEVSDEMTKQELTAAGASDLKYILEDSLNIKVDSVCMNDIAPNIIHSLAKGEILTEILRSSNEIS